MTKTLGQMTPAERERAVADAAALFQAELTATAPALGRTLEAMAVADLREWLTLRGVPAHQLDEMATDLADLTRDQLDDFREQLERALIHNGLD